MQNVLILLAAYLLGTIPFGLLTGKLVKGVDIRRMGSGNIGATNVGRVLGMRWGLLVLVLDALKGLLPTGLLPLAAAGSEAAAGHLRVGCGLAAVVGHMFPCWLGFRGGKGVATALGAVAIIAPGATLAAFVAFALTFAASRFVSLSSIVASVTFAAVEIVRLLPDPFGPDTWSRAGFALLVPLLIVVRHRSNIARLLRGEESRFGERGTESSDGEGGQESSDGEGGQESSDGEGGQESSDGERGA